MSGIPNSEISISKQISAIQEEIQQVEQKAQGEVVLLRGKITNLQTACTHKFKNQGDGPELEPSLMKADVFTCNQIIREGPDDTHPPTFKVGCEVCTLVKSVPLNSVCPKCFGEMVEIEKYSPNSQVHTYPCYMGAGWDGGEILYKCAACSIKLALRVFIEYDK